MLMGVRVCMDWNKWNENRSTTDTTNREIMTRDI